MDCSIELSVYDLRGRLVEELINGHMEAGSYKIKWHAGESSSGVYLVRMVTPQTVFNRKLVLMK